MEHLSEEKIGLGWMDQMMDMKVTIIGHYSTLLEEVSTYMNKVDSYGIQLQNNSQIMGKFTENLMDTMIGCIMVSQVYTYIISVWLTHL